MAGVGADASPRRASGSYQQQPSRIKSFCRQNANSPRRRVILPLAYASVVILYFHRLLFLDVGSGVHVLRNNKIVDKNVVVASAPVWGSKEHVRLEPRSLADVAIANAEVALKRQVEYRENLRKRAEMREEKRRQREAARLEKLQLANNATVAVSAAGASANDNDAGAVPDFIRSNPDLESVYLANRVAKGSADSNNVKNVEQLVTTLLKSNRTAATKLESESTEEYVKRLSNLAVKRTPTNRRGKTLRQGQSNGTGEDPGYLVVLMMIFSCTVFRLCVNVLISRTADGIGGLDDDLDESDNDAAAAARLGAGMGLPASLFMGGREAARLRRRARARHASRQFARFVDRLNAEREANGERRISADTLRHLVNARDFNGNDYDRLSSFVEENGPAMGSIFSAIGATEAEIGRCPTRVLGEGDDLLRRTSSRQQIFVEGGAGDESGAQGRQRNHQSCSICLEQYQLGEAVRTIPCFHTFHKTCIDPWLAQRAECPICKHSAIG